MENRGGSMIWKKDNFELSTDPTLLPLTSVNDLFGSSDVYWAKPLPDRELRLMVEKSLCFGLYDISFHGSEDPIHTTAASEQPGMVNKSRKLVGFARCISDWVTVVYVTDVYILPSYRGRGLGAWMMCCIDESLKSMEHLRGVVLIADEGGTAEKLYTKHFGMRKAPSPAMLMEKVPAEESSRLEET